MKWLLLITLSLYSFIVQSAPCALTNVGEQRGTYILKPLSMKGNLTAEKLKTPEILTNIYESVLFHTGLMQIQRLLLKHL